MAGNVRRQKFVSEDAVLALIEATDGGRFGLRDRALLGVLYGCGLRVGEAVGIDCQDVLYEERIIVVNGKQGVFRDVPVAGIVLEWILQYLSQGRDEGFRVEGFLFRSKSGKALGVRQVRRIVDKYAGKVDLPKISPHTLRHSCASHLLAHGMYLPDLARLLGHRLLSTTTIYLHEVPSPLSLDAQYHSAHPLAGK